MGFSVVRASFSGVSLDTIAGVREPKKTATKEAEWIPDRQLEAGRPTQGFRLGSVGESTYQPNLQTLSPVYTI